MRCAILVAGWGYFVFGLYVGGDAEAQTTPNYTIWKAELGASGDWFDPALWTMGVPTTELDALHANGSEILFSSGTVATRSLTLSHPNGGLSRLTQTGGTLAVENTFRLFDGIYRLVDGELDAATLNMGDGLFLLLPIDFSDVPWPEVGLFNSQAEFHLEGGRLAIDDEVRLGRAQLRITGGEMQAGRMFVDALAWNGSLGGFGDVEALQTDGSVSLDGDLKIQDGTYELAGGSLTVNRLVMGDPSEQEWIISNVSRTPAFRQSGGTMQVLGNLELCMPGDIFWQPVEPFTDITYYLDAGTIHVAGDSVVGSLGVAPARFFQSDGTQTTVGTLRIEGEASIYAISGGQLHVGKLHVGTDEFNEGGTFSVRSKNAEIYVEAGVKLGDVARVEAVPNSAIHLLGGDVELLGDDASLLAGLANLSLVVESGDALTKLEAAGADLGNRMSGYVGNFAWDTLQIGGAITGHLQLMDLVVNQAGGLPEAIYVDRLVIGAGSTLDLGELNLYYRQASIEGEVLSAGGAMLLAVPEPSAVVLKGLTLTAMLMWMRCRRYRGLG